MATSKIKRAKTKMAIVEESSSTEEDEIFEDVVVEAEVVREEMEALRPKDHNRECLEIEVKAARKAKSQKKKSGL